MSFFFSHATSSGWGHWIESSTWSRGISAAHFLWSYLVLTGNGLDLDVGSKELLDTVDVEVGDTDGTGQALVNELLDQLSAPCDFLRSAHLLHSLPCGGDVIGERNVELLLAVLSLDGVVLGGENALGSVNLEVDLIVLA